jgi:hypothetical protein
MHQNSCKKPLLFLDVDGLISLFGFSSREAPPGRFHWIDGVVHCIDGEACGGRVRALSEHYEVVWATGWEEKANEYLPQLLSLETSELPVLSFGGRARFGSAHWKVDAIDDYARGRAAAWVDDFLDEHCERWAGERSEPTLLVRTQPATGLTDELVEQLIGWAKQL